MSDNVTPIRPPTRLPADLNYFLVEMLGSIEVIPEQLRDCGFTVAECAELQEATDTLVAAYRRHLPPQQG